MDKSSSVHSAPWSHSREEVLEALDVSRETGLDSTEAQRRLRDHGRNRLRHPESRTPWTILLDQFKSLVVLLLAAATVLSFLLGETLEGIAIAAVIGINTGISFYAEMRAVRSMEALQRLGSVETKVRRDGQARVVPAERLVPGDIVLLDSGDVVTADIRLLQSSKLQVDESALTGESVPVGKDVEPIDEDAPLAERENMVHKGTAVLRGSCHGVVVATGMRTELGRISTLAEEVEEETTPLERRLEKLGQRLIGITMGLAGLVAVSGIITGKDLFLMVETAIALAIATVPEGLPLVATVALARGMWRMARRNALVNRLSSVETLGATTVILTDKTGTLTENQMTVTRISTSSREFDVEGLGLETEGEFVSDGESIDPEDSELLRWILRAGVLCNNASLEHISDEEVRVVGNPMESALLVAGAKAGILRSDVLEEMPEEREVAFDPDQKMMATFHAVDDGHQVAVKGAPEEVLRVCEFVLTDEHREELTDEDREEWLDHSQDMAEEGLRVLALAEKSVEDSEAEAYDRLTFLGIFGLLDPAREDVPESIELCQRAGVRVTMVTGDHPATARNIALSIGLTGHEDVEVVLGSEVESPDELSAEKRQELLEAPIFARVSPEQKLDLIGLNQSDGSIVAMTGDGVNDAPALKKADIGVAMGQRGTQVAREAADMILEDDAFGTIVAAIEQGRVLFRNIRSFVFYLLSCNLSEVLTVSLASIVNAPLPLLPLQILFLNIVTDVFPAFALGVGGGSPEIMEQSPRDPEEPVLTRPHWLSIGQYGLMITLPVLGALWIALTWLGMDQRQAVTVSFLTLAFAQLWHVFNMREPYSGFFSNSVTRNVWVWGALALCTGLILSAVYVPSLAVVFKVVDPGVTGWMLVLSMSLVPWALGQLLIQLGRSVSLR